MMSVLFYGGGGQSELEKVLITLKKFSYVDMNIYQYLFKYY